MSNNTTPSNTPVHPSTAQTIAATGASWAKITVAGGAIGPIGHSNPSQLTGIIGRINSIRLYDYAYAPDHPQDWQHITTRDLEDKELFDVQAWLRLMTTSAYDTITHYTPAMRMLVYFERSQDAAMFKLAWGGE